MIYLEIYRKMQEELVRYIDAERGGYEYDVTDEQIRRWETVPVVERLRWLEEANEFLYLAQDAETRARWQAVRRGER